MVRRFHRLWLVLSLVPVSLQAQPGIGSEAEAGVAVSGRVGMTWIGDRATPVGSLAGTLRLSPYLELGGEGLLLLRPVRLSPEGSPDESELRSGYGGVVLRWRPAGNVPGARWGGSLLLGSGTARVRSRLVDAELASQNFFFFEPGFHVLLRQDRAVRVSADAGYRITFGANALPGLNPGEFRAPLLSFTIQIVRDP